MDRPDAAKEAYGCVRFLWNLWYDLCRPEHDDTDDELASDEECMEALEVEPDPSAVTDGDDWDYHQGYSSGCGAMNVRMISLL